MKIIIDMNLSPSWVPYFTSKGWESKHWLEIGEPNASDREIMNWAKSQGYIVFTHDLDFTTILALTEAIGPSVIQVRTQNVMPEHLAEIVIHTLHKFQSELEKGAVISIDENKARIRILPLY